MDIREVKIEEYWPLIVRGTEEFGQIAVAENDEFNKLAACIYEVLNNSFIKEATEYGVGRWEKMLGLTVTSDMTLEDRKAAILTRLSVKLPYTVRVLKQMLTGLLGEGNFRFAIDNDTQVLTIHFPMDITDSQLVSVEDMLSRVLPTNLVINKVWMNGLPWEYTPIEYLESNANAYIKTDYVPEVGCEIWCTQKIDKNSRATFGAGTGYPNLLVLVYDAGTQKGFMGFFNNTPAASLPWNLQKHTVHFKPDGTITDGINSTSVEFAGTRTATPLYLFTRADNLSVRTTCQIYNLRIKHTRSIDLLPALDPTGAPCMFDIVSGQRYYNSGTGEFNYPTQAAPAAPAGLDDKFYAKLTEHGVRRLYHVPKGSTMSVDEYAAANGFKELVEPPMPYEGYWVNVWCETDTQLICEWVETEPPVEEEVIENE